VLFHTGGIRENGWSEIVASLQVLTEFWQLTSKGHKERKCEHTTLFVNLWNKINAPKQTSK
jgi:hypothetical protein